MIPIGTVENPEHQAVGRRIAHIAVLEVHEARFTEEGAHPRDLFRGKRHADGRTVPPANCKRPPIRANHQFFESLSVSPIRGETHHRVAGQHLRWIIDPPVRAMDSDRSGSRPAGGKGRDRAELAGSERGSRNTPPDGADLDDLAGSRADLEPRKYPVRIGTRSPDLDVDRLALLDALGDDRSSDGGQRGRRRTRRLIAAAGQDDERAEDQGRDQERKERAGTNGCPTFHGDLPVGVAPLGNDGTASRPE